MKFVNHKSTIELPSIEKMALEKVHFSSKMDPYVDNERSFIGYTRCTSNVLAEVDRDDSARRAMRKDAR